MKAVQLLAHGSPGNIEVRDIPAPKPAPADALIRVEACGLNHLDLWTEQGSLPIPIHLPRVPGCEIAGVIVEFGGAAPKHWRPGDRVAVQSNLFCGHCEFCLKGEESLCLNSELLGVQRDGGFAELVAVPVDALVALPDNVSFETAAALGLAGSTAMHMLTQRARVEPGQWVLVMGGASGVGSAAIQIAKELRANVIATGSTQEKRTLCKSLGAAHAIDLADDDWPKQVRQITQKHGADLVVEHLGGKYFERLFECLARNGTIVTCGATTGPQVELNLWPFFVKQQRIIGSYGRNRADLRATLEWASEERLRPVIDEVFDLQGALTAYHRLRDRQIKGKAVIKPSLTD